MGDRSKLRVQVQPIPELNVTTGKMVGLFLSKKVKRVPYWGAHLPNTGCWARMWTDHRIRVQWPPSQLEETQLKNPPKSHKTCIIRGSNTKESRQRFWRHQLINAIARSVDQTSVRKRAVDARYGKSKCFVGGGRHNVMFDTPQDNTQ